MEVLSSTNSPRAYDAVGGDADLKNVGSFVPFVVTRSDAKTIKIHFGSTHNDISKKATGLKLGAGSVVRENEGELLMLPSHHKHGIIPKEVVEAVKNKLAQLLGEEVEIGEASKFKGRKKKSE